MKGVGVSAKLMAIVAVDLGGVIGAQGGIPWRLSTDLRRFKALSMGRPLIMGRRTFDAIGRPLPGRQTVVVTRQEGWHHEGCHRAATPEAALSLARELDDEVVINAGGAQLYGALMSQTDQIALSIVHTRAAGDTRLPALNPSGWRVLTREVHEAGPRDEHAHTFLMLERVGGEVVPHGVDARDWPTAWVS